MIAQKQPEKEEYFNYLGCMITNDARCIRQIKSRIVMGTAAFNKKTILTSKLDVNLRKKIVKCHVTAWNRFCPGFITLIENMNRGGKTLLPVLVHLEHSFVSC
jgi:hypothetical protein